MRLSVFIVCLLVIGCSKQEALKPPLGEQAEGKLDFTGLRGVLSGKWAKKADPYHRLDFTAKSIEQLIGGYGRPPDVGKYEQKGDLLSITDRDGDLNIYGLEYLSDSEIALRPEKLKNGSDFNDLQGQWRRISLPTGSDAVVQGTGPIAEARRQVKKFEKKRAAIEPLLEKALADRDELVMKLREAGVHKAADLKGNLQGQKLAASLQRLTGEIDGLERQVAAIDSAILEAKAVVRRLEREKAGISDEEMRKLAEQLREAEERTDGAARLMTPLDVEAALEKALKGPSGKSPKASPAKSVSRLVGKWEVAGGKRKGTVEFTTGGTALVAWSDSIRNALGERERRATLKYTLTRYSLKLEEPGSFEYRQTCDIQIEAISDNEMIFVNQKNSLSFDWLDGRLRRAKE